MTTTPNGWHSVSSLDHIFSLVEMNINLHSLALSILTLLFLSCPSARATYDGDFVGATQYDPIAFGDTLYINISVQNIGTDSWTLYLPDLFHCYTPWRVKGYCGWPFAHDITFGGWETIVPGQVDSAEISWPPAYLPTTTGIYSISLMAQYRYVDSYYSDMSNSPRTITFAVSDLADNVWTNNEGTSNWGERRNWSNRNVATSCHNVVFTDTGISSGTTVNLGSDRTVNSLAINCTKDLLIGGTSGSLTVSGGSITRGAGSAGSQTISRPIALGADGDWDLSGAGQLIVSGGISGSYSLEKRGTATLILNNSNTYSGDTRITAGTLSLDTYGQISSSLINNNAAFKILAGNHTLGDIVGTGMTSVESGTLTVRSIDCGTLSLGPGTALILQPLPGGLTARDHELTPVPEPSSLVLLLVGFISPMFLRLQRID